MAKQVTLLSISCFIVFNISYAQFYPITTIMENWGQTNPYWELGTGFLGLGDINNDTWPDIAVGAAGLQKTLIYFGGPGILDQKSDVMIKGSWPLGFADVNGDGIKDLFTLTPAYGFLIRQDSMVSASDSVYVYFGKSNSPLRIDTIPGCVIGGEGGYFGRSFAIGDLNGDGYNDVVIGAPGHNPGKVYVYFGKKYFDGKCDQSLEGRLGYLLGREFGYRIKIKDFNGDGIGDLAVSASENLLKVPTLEIFYGKKNWTFSRENSYQLLPSKFFYGIQNIYEFSAMDFNYDGKADLYFQGTNGDNGYVFFGREDSIHWGPDMIFPNPDPGFVTSLGVNADRIGDFNGDGVEDFYITAGFSGSPGIIVYLGKSKPPTQWKAARAISGVLAIYISALGDINGDGVDDFGFSAPYDYSPGGDIGYFVILSGNRYLTSIQGNEQPPDTYSLLQNYPNPFNPSTTIEYQLSKRASVSVIIYDCLGKEVLRLFNGLQEAGKHHVGWDGTTASGVKVSSGNYYIRL
ncbi:MAG: FG-GAP-like repeat-containing protein [bacterium]